MREKLNTFRQRRSQQPPPRSHGRPFSISRDELVVETARALGYGRTGSKLKRVIGHSIDSLVQQEILQEEGEELRVVE